MPHLIELPHHLHRLPVSDLPLVNVSPSRLQVCLVKLIDTLQPIHTIAQQKQKLMRHQEHRTLLHLHSFLFFNLNSFRFVVLQI